LSEEGRKKRAKLTPYLLIDPKGREDRRERNPTGQEGFLPLNNLRSEMGGAYVRR
jgi:hypothetical protein